MICGDLKSDQFWSNLFALKRKLYLMGASAEYGHIVIRTSDDDGKTWSEAHFLTQGTGFHTAPVPVVIKNGRLYRAFEFHPTGPWGPFQAFIMSAPVESDLTKPESWTFTNKLSFPVSDIGDTWLEGNAMIAPDGSIVDVLRVNNSSHAAILKLTGDKLKFWRFVDLPGGPTKFTIRFDAKTKLYWALTNPALPGELNTVSSPASVRNTLALVSSPDLIHWTPRSIILHHPDVTHHAFQYVDWQFDGNDTVAVSRTAFDDNEGGANSFHNANFLTFHRIANFRRLGTVSLKGSPFTQAEVISAEQMKKWEKSTAVDAGKREDSVDSQPIGSYGTHMVALSTRVKTGEAEMHRDWDDIFVVVSGEATLVSGGKLIDQKTIAAGEYRGGSISNGHTAALTPGAVVHIDANIPHQLLIKNGEPFSYSVVKAKAQ